MFAISKKQREVVHVLAVMSGAQVSWSRFDVEGLVDVHFALSGLRLAKIVAVQVSYVGSVLVKVVFEKTKVLDYVRELILT